MVKITPPKLKAANNKYGGIAAIIGGVTANTTGLAYRGCCCVGLLASCSANFLYLYHIIMISVTVIVGCCY